MMNQSNSVGIIGRAYIIYMYIYAVYINIGYEFITRPFVKEHACFLYFT